MLLGFTFILLILIQSVIKKIFCSSGAGRNWRVEVQREPGRGSTELCFIILFTVDTCLLDLSSGLSLGFLLTGELFHFTTYLDRKGETGTARVGNLIFAIRTGMVGGCQICVVWVGIWVRLKGELGKGGLRIESRNFKIVTGRDRYGRNLRGYWSCYLSACPEPSTPRTNQVIVSSCLGLWLLFLNVARLVYIKSVLIDDLVMDKVTYVALYNHGPVGRVLCWRCTCLGFKFDVTSAEKSQSDISRMRDDNAKVTDLCRQSLG